MFLAIGSSSVATGGGGGGDEVAGRLMGEVGRAGNSVVGGWGSTVGVAFNL